MCEYSCANGMANDWHLVHLGSRAVGGAGLILTEAAAVVPEGRISPEDLGVWSEAHFEPLARAAHFIAAQGSVAGIQLAHAGRKASTYRPWPDTPSGVIAETDGGWETVAPSAQAFSTTYPMPRALTLEEIAAVIQAFVAAATRAVEAGFRVIELHGAHGYLLHEFLSPLSNQRTDQYGGSFDNRIRLLCETAAATRAALPDGIPLFVRISATDWVEGGWNVEQSVALARRLKDVGVDLVDCSTGGNVDGAKIPVGAGYQLPFADRIRREVGNFHRRGRHDHRRGAGRPDHPQRPGRPGADGTRDAARSLLAAARGGGTARQGTLARPVSARRAAWLASPLQPGCSRGMSMSDTTDRRAYAPAASRNREAILAVLERALPPSGLVLEVSSGTGEHAAFFAAGLPQLEWQPTDRDERALPSIAAHRAVAGLGNLLPPLVLDAASPDLAGGAGQRGRLHQYDPYRTLGGLRGADGGRGRGHCRRTACFFSTDRIKKAASIRRTATTDSTSTCSRATRPGAYAIWRMWAALAGRHGLTHIETVAMPANNRSVLFVKGTQHTHARMG